MNTCCAYERAQASPSPSGSGAGRPAPQQMADALYNKQNPKHRLIHTTDNYDQSKSRRAGSVDTEEASCCAAPKAARCPLHSACCCMVSM